MLTIGDIKNSIRLEFGKTSPRLDAVIQDEVTARLREICSDFPYWYLKIDPGFDLPAGFPYTDPDDLPSPGAGNFLDQGWLLLEPTQEYYPLYLPTTGTPGEPASWVQVEASRINYAKTYSIQGGLQNDLGVNGGNTYWSGPSMSRDPGSPQGIMLQNAVDGKSYIRLHPTPSEPCLLALSFNLATPPWIGSGDFAVNFITKYYPRMVKLVAGLCYADFFHDAKMYSKYSRELFGDTDDGKNTSNIPNGGLVGKMKRDTEFRDIQESDEMPYYASMSESLGRGGYNSHYPGAPFYLGPSGNYG